MSNSGSALMGIGEASGENAAVDAAKAAVNSPLLETSIDGARGILLNITGATENLTMYEVGEASTTIQEAAHVDANIIFGAAIDDTLGDTVRVTVIATGFDEPEKLGVQPSVAAATAPAATAAGQQPSASAAAPQPPVQPAAPKIDLPDIPIWMRKH